MKNITKKNGTNLSRNCRDNNGSRRRVFSRILVCGRVCFYGNSTFAFNHGFNNIWFELFIVNYFDYLSFLYYDAFLPPFFVTTEHLLYILFHPLVDTG